jgi:spermidine synthase
LLAIYTLTIFVSASLLFLVQPLFARMVLPLLGGSPSVWNTAVVFYQVVLLLGYGYAHVTTRWLGVRRQALLHAVIILLPLLVLPIAIPAGWVPPADTSPIPWLLSLLLVAVGLPYFVVTTSSPLIQKWFSHTGHPSAADPYFLYAASNVGSVLALLSYPFLMEPNLLLAEQSWTWAAGYALLVMLTLACALFVWRSSAAQGANTAPVAEESQPAASSERLGVGRRMRWVFLAFIPSSLMLSVTTYLSSNLASIPLLWIIPLIIYLFTFILVFARRTLLPHTIMVRALPIFLLPLVIVVIVQPIGPQSLLIPLHLVTFFIAAMVCHGELAQDRPSPQHLTEFYLWLSVGGALGGMFNALLAPVLFTTVVEYPLMLVLVCLAQWRPEPLRLQTRSVRLDFGLPLALAVLVVGLILSLQSTGWVSGPVSLGVMFGGPVLLGFSFSRRPVRFALGVGALLLAGGVYTSAEGQVLYTERSFFGIHRVTLDREEQYHMLLHGNTVHGIQSRDVTRHQEPLSYYYPTGPIGQVFAELNEQQERMQVAVVGLGVGALACYNEPGQTWTFYEIDPVVEHIARDTGYFTYLQECAPQAEIVLGDARLSLVDAPDQQYDLLVLDAYSSDAVPIHLLTREALALYLDKLAPEGVLAFHISSRYFELAPVLGNLAQDAQLHARLRRDSVTPEESERGKWTSNWVVMARNAATLEQVTDDTRWQRLYADPTTNVWTDDYSSILSVMK